jgi:hypothetical protein
MPIDRNTLNNPRPVKPTLASNRTAKTPLTPRLALAPSTPTPAAQPGRPLRSANNPSAPRLAVAAPTHHDDVTTPTRPLLATNITPRSSARKTRVGGSSVGSTPSGTPSITPSTTPIPSRPASTVDFAHREHGHAQSGPAITVGNSAPARPRSTLGITNHSSQQAPRLPLSSVYNHTPPDAARSKHASSMFFHADAARSPQEPAGPQKKAPVFFHANGLQAEGPRKREVPSPPGSTVSRGPPSSVGRSQPEAKFFHADSISDAKTGPILTPPPLAPTTEFPLHSTSTSAHGLSGRAPSPTKDGGHMSYRKGTSQITRPNLASRNSALSVLSGVSVSDESSLAHRRPSAASSLIRASHGKSASLSSIDSVAELKQAPLNDIHPTLHLPQRTNSNSSQPDNAVASPSPLANSLNALHSPGLASPGNGQTPLEMMNELAANARRERKVLDLEISNSSLLAINRSLEKEVRKQKAELRRFRRMSRAGHFSADSISTLDKGLGNAGHLSDMSEAEEEPPEEDLEGSESSFDENVASDDQQAKNDEVYRLRDEKRLQLDLSKHQELLDDSQKMNQSLKRCLGWTDQLIKDAQKALDYKVRPSDVQLGGRVLISEEDDDDSLTATHPGESHGLLSPWSPHRGADTLDLPKTTGRMENRDSGVDVSGLKHSQAHPRGGAHLPDDLTPLSSPFGEKLEFLHAAIDELEAS